MTQKVNPSQNRIAESFKSAGSMAYGGVENGFVQPGNNPTPIAVQDGDISDSALDGFTKSSSASSFDVTITPGEAFVFGSWLAKDTNTTVTLASSTTGQTVYVGWDKDASDTVIVGLSGAFASADERIPIWTFDTDGSGVTNSVDERSLGKPIQYDSNGNILDQSGNKIYDQDTDQITADLDTSGTTNVGSLNASGDITDDQGNTIWDYSNQYIPSSSIQDSYLLNTGDTLEGTLDANANSSGRIVLPVGTDQWAN